MMPAFLAELLAAAQTCSLVLNLWFRVCKEHDVIHVFELSVYIVVYLHNCIYYIGYTYFVTACTYTLHVLYTTLCIYIHVDVQIHLFVYRHTPNVWYLRIFAFCIMISNDSCDLRGVSRYAWGWWAFEVAQLVFAYQKWLQFWKKLLLRCGYVAWRVG